MIKRALISVSDKDGIVEFSKKLYDKGVEILSTGGTAKLLRNNGVDVVDVSEYTGHPEMMDGRVKTLHPKIHGALLALRDNPDHMKAAEEHDIGLIDLAVVNLYPFEETIKKEGVKLEDAIENIDIGGPSMLRSAAKNFRYVTVVTDPSDYEKVISEIEANGDTSEETRRYLAEKVFQKTAHYDSMIASYLTGGKSEHIIVEKLMDLRYGENPHQKATFYRDKNGHNEASLDKAEQLQGKELSYNNIMDADGALSLVREFTEPTVAFIKHANPCGIATSDTISDAFVNAYEGDPKSAFGGVIAFNKTCTKDIAESITSKFFEVVIAPGYEDGALEAFKAKPNLRILKIGAIKPEPAGKTYRKVSNGLLIQDLDTKQIRESDLKIVTKRKPTTQEMKDLLFGWHVVKHVKSNAIVLAKNGMTVGIGAGQMSRVDAVEIAIKKAMNREDNSVMASDAFFPFPDSIEKAAEHKITAIIQPGGSIKDEEIIAAADKAGIAMVFTGARAFFH
ncbi:bifunctional phosphoribosylaminoimidazolecarboxamide formyltransferase/IMP cyclohydrolase [bacterium]|nr:bifunctional phosphoribosylaminoimidazolecarboxamide formyltransferase/IMP cyclohydrolase [Patescibacteria group bacterium]MBU1626582.1 bifunctional phosphoribosylaminoimidazolecarboxamide formyltransferase/IMP cyclohydrolase [bacterium]